MKKIQQKKNKIQIQLLKISISTGIPSSKFSLEASN